jgi:PAS domain S-box-containing protein
MTHSFQTTRNMRRGFALVLLCLLGFAISYSWYSWQTVKQEQTEQLALLADLESKFLDSFFTHFESSLSILSQDLQGEKLTLGGERAHFLLKRFKQANQDMANINLVQAGGQVVASALNPPGSRMPNIAQEPSFILGRDALLIGADFNIGRPFLGRLVNEWIIPLRYAIRDGKGKLLYIIQATLPLSRQQSFWQSLYLPRDAVLGLLRDDGYLLSRYPSPAASELEKIYGNPIDGLVTRFLKANGLPQQGVVEGLTPRGSNDVVAFHRLAWYPLTLLVGTSLAHIRSLWWESNRAFYLLTLMFLLSGVAIYLWLMRRQVNWELERERVNQQLIAANHAKDQAENELLARELDYVKLALDQHSIVSIADVQGDITYANDKFCALSGYSSGELLGRNHRVLNSGLHTDEFIIDMWVAIASGKVWHGEIRNKSKDGRYYWVDTTIVPFMNKDGVPYQYVSVGTDISPYIEARAAAELANRAKSQFLSSMSHELRTPMNAVLGFAQLLDMQIEAGQTAQRQFVRHILTAGHQLLGLIDDLLDLSRIEIGKLEFNIQNIGIAELAASCTTLVANSLAGKRNITIVNRILDPELSVRGDSLRIRQVLINLLSNAVKYNRDNGTVTLSSLLQEDGRLRIQVSDTGAGIASDKLSLLFKNFERIDQKHGTIEGAGIGLYVCKQLVVAMHGEIGVESVKGEGSTFWFVLPLAGASSEAADSSGADNR